MSLFFFVLLSGCFPEIPVAEPSQGPGDDTAGPQVDPCTVYADTDGDGFGDPNTGTEVDCIAPPSGWVLDNQDCDDSTDATHPGAAEYCDGQDNDCNGLVDDAPVDPVSFFVDGDGDSFGGEETTACSMPGDGFTPEGGDCDDSNPDVYPGAPTACTSVDHDCDGQLDDQDGDADGSPECEDCDDSNALMHPGLLEICDSLDNDCDGNVDEDAVDATSVYPDADGDGHGDASGERIGCEGLSGYVLTSDDCDDEDALVWADCSSDSGDSGDSG